jgi:hypothetical protein
LEVGKFLKSAHGAHLQSHEKVHHSLYAFEHEPESVPSMFELPSMLDAMHLAAICSQINPLACLPVINAMTDEFDHHDTAQYAVN